MSWLAILVAASLSCLPPVTGQFPNATTLIQVPSSTSVALTSGVIGNGTTNGYPPYGPILRSYMAIGDSFSAGNGAGDLVSPDQPKCRRTSGSYVYQLLNDPIYWQFVDPGNPFEFNACSGAITSEIQNNQILNPTTQNPPYKPFIRGADLYTMSAGGNDLNFDAIVRTCVYNLGWPGSCAKNLAAVTAALQSGSAFDTSLTQLYNTLFSQSDGGQVIIVPYVQFYNDQGPSTYFSKCHVSQSIRQQLNQAVTAVNAFLQSRASRYGTFSMLDDGSLQSAFDGHRFCDDGEIWIQDSLFASLSPTAQAQYNSNGTLPVDVANALNSTLTQDGQLLDPANDDNGNIGNIFHPTFQGHTAYYKLVAGAISPAVAKKVGTVSAIPRPVVPQPVS